MLGLRQRLHISVKKFPSTVKEPKPGQVLDSLGNIKFSYLYVKESSGIFMDLNSETDLSNTSKDAKFLEVPLGHHGESRVWAPDEQILF